MNKIKCKIELTFDKDLLCDQETLDDHFDGKWSEFFKTILKEDGLAEFVHWADEFELVEAIDE